MPLDKPTLVANLTTILSNPATTNNVTAVAEQLADAFEAYVKSGTVIGTCPPNGGELINGKVE